MCDRPAFLLSFSSFFLIFFHERSSSSVPPHKVFIGRLLPSSANTYPPRSDPQTKIRMEIVNGFVGNFSELLGGLVAKKISSCIYLKENIKKLEEKLEELKSQVSDVEQELKEGEQSGRKKRTSEVENWLNKAEEIAKKISEVKELLRERCLKRLKNADRVKKLHARVVKLMELRRRFCRILLDVETKGDQLLTAKLFGEEVNQSLEKLWACLESDADDVSSIGIYGMGGVGKTTLAKHIFNSLKEKTCEVFWVTVSHEFSIRKLQEDIAKVLGVDLSHEDDEDKRAAILSLASANRDKFVLILDDVWEGFSLHMMGNPLAARGCRLILTTRLLEVCRNIGCQRIFEVKTLDLEESWNLLKEKLGNETVLPLDVEEVAKSVARRCDGLPLGIVTMAGSMRGITDIYEWRDALEELKEFPMERGDMESKVYPVLRYSFTRLRDERLRNCFLYCCLYPEDFEIPRDELINMLILEGLMDRRKSRQAEFDQGHAILNKLGSVCLLENAKDVYDNKCVKMHDLVRDIAIRITKDKPKFMVKAGLELSEIPEDQEWKEDLEKVSLMRNRISFIPHGISPKCTKLSTLILRENYHLKSIADTFFVHMPALRVLDLGGNEELEELPETISDLRNLTALLLGGCDKLERVPSLEKLKKLKELDLSWTGIKEVPEGMESLVKLKVLNMNNMRNLESIPPEVLPKLTHLQRLRTSRHLPLQIEEVPGSKHLEEFEGTFGSVIAFNKFFQVEERSSKQLRLYNVSLSGAKEDYSAEFDGKEVTCKNYCLERRGVGGEEDGVWLPQCIQHLRIHQCRGMIRSMLDVFPSLLYSGSDLKHLRIEYCSNIRCIMRLCTSSSGEIAIEREGASYDCIPLQSLESLYLCGLPNFIGLFLQEAGAVADGPSRPCGTFTSLKTLTIQGCHRIKKLFKVPLLMQNLRNLEVLEVRGCNQIEEIIAEDDDGGRLSSSSESCFSSSSLSTSSASSSSLSASPSGHCTNNMTSIVLPKLRVIDLGGLRELKSICKGTLICESIEKILVIRCLKIRRLPFFVYSLERQSLPPSFKEITIDRHEKKWWDLLHWDHPDTKDVLQPFLKYS